MAHGSEEDPTAGGGLPEAPVDQFTRPVAQFLRVQALSGILLALCTVAALIAANGGAYDAWKGFWDTEITVAAGSFDLTYPLWYWVNDALMVIFFFVVGLEIKREVADGHLSNRRALMLPLAAAVGGAVVPALIFYWIENGTEGARGWAIPMATDIAFVVGCLALLGSRVPAGLKIFVLSLAIVDDLIAVLVIALFYAESISTMWLAGSAVGIAIVVLLQKLGVRRIGIYVIVGSVLWLCMFKSGVHPTVAGVILGILTPVKPWVSRPSIREVIRTTTLAIDDAEARGTRAHMALERLAFASREARSPLDRLEYRLHPWVSFVIMPIFALANAAVPISADAVSDPLSLAIAGGLVLGKPFGITLAALVVVGLGLASLPRGVNWGMIIGAGVLSGTGFTMSLFIGSLAFPDGSPLVDIARTGILVGSAVSIVAGMAVLFVAIRRPVKEALVS
ncbi:Na(+)/H(+) antiporter NhaA [Planctomycetes bacterium Pla163]|uniref:Na(+)/H(+) antiporter NhaA n=1 Tax=Rohdeia mirabilis TaxID=2528008 RepID=A0A518CYX0_9BACT|nr:Na(+)/H(+) antiporter NhaA [Planctomycetes bacterium Pla163]